MKPHPYLSQLRSANLVRCLVKEFGANINKAMYDGVTPLMLAARYGHEDVATFFIKYGANAHVVAPDFGTVAEVSERVEASAKQTLYLKVRPHCAKPGCDALRKARVKKYAGYLKLYARENAS
jgi:ankyrin repeat protein